MIRKQVSASARIALAITLLGTGACDSGGGADASAHDEGAIGTPHYVLAAIVSSGDDANMYVSLVDSLDGQTVDHKQGREFSGSSDLWVYEGALFVADAENLTITKYTLRGRELVEGARISFSDYGIIGFGFWLNNFVDAHKAYLLNESTEYIIWDPSEMKITGTLPFPALASDGLHVPVPAYSDRAAPQRDGLLYQPIYYSDDTYFDFAQNTTILVIDTESDEIIDVLEAPCPGLDFATQVDNGDLYFSSWVFAPPGAAVLDGPKTCIAKVPADAPHSVELAFNVADVTDGREGGVFRYLGDGRATLSVLHDDEARKADVSDVQEVGYGPYWRFWSFDISNAASAPIDSIDWNAGAAYPAEVENPYTVLIPAGDYASTTVYDLSGTTPVELLKTQGWALRLFKL